MRTPPRPIPTTERLFRSPLFKTANILQLSKAVEPSFDFAQAEMMALDLESDFSIALRWGDDHVNFRVLEDFYARVAYDLRRLASTLGLPTDPSKIASQFPLGQKIDERTKIPDGLAWLLDGGSQAIDDSKEFTSLIANSLSNPDDPGDWRSVDSRIESASDQMRGQNLSDAANALRPAFEAALAECGIALVSIPPELVVTALNHMANFGTSAVDALDISYLQASGCGDGAYALLEERRHDFFSSQMCSLPFLLALALGAAIEALRSVKNRPRYQNWNRCFRNDLFDLLVSTHTDFFGRPPKVRDSDNLPEGSGVYWTQGILGLAAENIDLAFANLEPDPSGRRKGAIQLVKQASCLAQETIADRLEAANKSLRIGDPKNQGGS